MERVWCVNTRGNKRFSIGRGVRRSASATETKASVLYAYQGWLVGWLVHPGASYESLRFTETTMMGTFGWGLLACPTQERNEYFKVGIERISDLGPGISSPPLFPMTMIFHDFYLPSN